MFIVHVHQSVWCKIYSNSDQDTPVASLQGIPLHLQIDTYEDLTNPDAEPVHRSFCQIKVFRDKVSDYHHSYLVDELMYFVATLSSIVPLFLITLV